MENNFGNMSPVVNHDIFADDMTDRAPTPIPLPSQLVVMEDSTIVPAAGSLGSPAAGSLHRHGSESTDRLTESQLRQLLEFRNYHFTDRISEEERQQRLSDSSLRQDMERQADDGRSTRGTSINVQRDLSDDQLRQELERRNIAIRVDTVDLTSRQPPDRTLYEARPGTVGSDRRYMTEGYTANPTSYHAPTTEEILAAHDMTRQQRDTDDAPHKSYQSYTTVATPHGPPPTKRTRSPSPPPTRNATQRIVTSVTSGDFTPLDEEITIEMALKFERQIARAPNVHLARDAITNRARRNMTTRLMADRHQSFVHPAKLAFWWDEIDCNTLATMVIKYFGPQSETTRTIDQSLRALPFSFNYGNRASEETTLNLHYELLEVHARSNGPFSPVQEVTMALIIEKRIIRHSALYQDFLARKAKDLTNRIPETTATCLQRITSCIQAVRDIAALVSRYGSFHAENVHSYSGTATDHDLEDHIGTSTSVPTVTRTGATSTAIIPRATPKPEPIVDATIKKRKPIEEPAEIYVAVLSSCHTCGLTAHTTRHCPHKGELDVNQTNQTWSKSPIGLIWAKCGYSTYQSDRELPDVPSTHMARAQRPPVVYDSNGPANSDSNKTDSRNNNSGRTGYLGSKPYNSKCKVSNHVVAALHNKDPNPDFLSAQIFLLQQMSRRGATTLAKDPTTAPPGSVLGQILLDTGSLAGDFISQDLLARLKGEIFVYQTPVPLTVCSGLDGTCYTSADMIDIAILIHTPRGFPKIIRFSVRINPSSSCDFIIGRKSLKKHNFFNMFPSHFLAVEFEPESGPFDELRWVNSTRKKKSRFAALPMTNNLSTPPARSETTVKGKVERVPQTSSPVAGLVTYSTPAKDPSTGLYTTDIDGTQPVYDSPTQHVISPPSYYTPNATSIGPPSHAAPHNGNTSTVHLPSPYPPGGHDQLLVGGALGIPSAGIPLPCPCQGSHCLIPSAPTMAKNTQHNRTKTIKRKRRGAALSAGQPTAGFGHPNTMAAMIEQTVTEDLSSLTWNPTRVVLAIDDINNDKTDTFAPFLTPDPTTPVTSFLDEITFGGDENLQKSLRALCTEYSDIFSDSLPPQAALLKPFEINVDKEKWERDTNRTPTRPQSSLKMKHIKKHIDDMLKTGIIEKADTAYYSHPVIVQKTEDSFRFCIDYRGLNEATEKASWPLPNITQLFDRMSAQRPDTFGVMDLTSGYHQAPLADSARKFTAFLCFAGLFQFTRLPFGPKRAPSYFQEQMASDVLAGLVYVICEIYLDDIIIYATGNDEFVDRTRQVFARLRLKGLRLKAKKTKLGLAKIEYVGKEISAKGLSMSTTRIRAFLDIPRPQTVTDLRKFLGVGNYFHQFIANHSAVVTHLHKMIEPKAKKSTKLAWSPEGLAAFESLRDLIANCPLLHFPDDTSPITLRTDASDFGVGGVLFQTIDRIENPIAFVSKSLTEVQLRWSVIQKEAYAIFHCCTQLDYLLRDRKFIIQTDHRNLTYMQKNTNSMVIRWDIALQELDYAVEYIKGADNEIADAMSRLCINRIAEPVQLLSAIHLLSDLSGDHLEALHMCHNSTVGHGGVDRTVGYLQRLGFTWPAMRRDTKQFIKTCPLCQKLDATKVIANTIKFTTSTYEPWQVLNMDFIGPYPTGEYVHIIIDTATRWVEISLWPDATATSASLALLSHIGRYGTPRQIRSDRGSHFANSLIKEFLELTGTPHNLTLAYSKEENAIVERANKEVNRHLRALIFDFPDINQLARRLPFVMRILNTTKNAVTGIAPAQLLFGNVIDLDEGILLPRSERPKFASLTDASAEMIKTQDELCRRAAELRRQADHAHLTSQDEIITIFEKGTYVLIQYVDQPPTRLHTKWSGPLQVLGHQNSEYKLLDLITRKEKLVHSTRIKQFNFNPREVYPLDIARRDYLEYFVDEILEHRGNPKKVSTLQFLVKWLNYTEKYNTWEPWANLRLVGPLHKYLRANQMEKLIPSTAKPPNRI